MIQITDHTGAPLGSLALTAERGVPSDKISIAIKNAGAFPINGAFVTMYAEKTSGAGDYDTSGHPSVDERQGRFQVTGVDSSGTAGQTVSDGGEQALGYLSQAVLPPILPGNTIFADVWIDQPQTSAGGGAVNVKIEIANDGFARPVGPGVTDVARGIISGVNTNDSFPLAGRVLSATGTPDNKVHLSIGSWLFQGVEGSSVAIEDITLDQNDASAVALVSGEAYVAAISQGSSGTATVTKGVKGVTTGLGPAFPTVPTGEILYGFVVVNYGASGSVIGSGDLSSIDLTYGRYLVTFPATGLTGTVHAGRALTNNYEQRNDVKTDVTLVDSATNYIWLEYTGVLTVTTTAGAPSPGALLLWEAVTSGGNVTGNTDERTFVGNSGTGVGIHAATHHTGGTDPLAAHDIGAASAADIALLAPLASPTFTGVPLAVTGVDGDASPQIATDEFVQNQLATQGDVGALDNYYTLANGVNATLNANRSGTVGGPTADFSLKGLITAFSGLGQRRRIYYEGSHTFTIVHKASGTPQSYQFVCPGGVDLALTGPGVSFYAIRKIEVSSGFAYWFVFDFMDAASGGSDPLKADKSLSVVASDGVTFGGSTDLSAAIHAKLDIPGLTSKATPIGADTAVIYDSVGAAHKKATLSSIVALATGGGSALTVEEVDGSPTDSAVTKIVFPNGTLAIASHIATYTPAGGGGGGGGSASSGLYAALPAPGNAGALYFATDGGFLMLDNGTSWEHYTSMVQMPGPATDPGTFYNLGSSGGHIDTSGGTCYYGVTITGAGGGAPIFREGAYGSGGQGKWLTAKMVLDIGVKEQDTFAGISFRDTSGVNANQVLLFGVYKVSNGDGKYSLLLQLDTNDGATYGANNVSITDFANPNTAVWLRMGDDGTNFLAQISTDGRHWRTIYGPATNGFYMSAPYDNWGIFLRPYYATYPMGVDFQVLGLFPM